MSGVETDFAEVVHLIEVARQRALQSVNTTLIDLTRESLFRMRQFYEAYRRNPSVAPLVRQLP